MSLAQNRYGENALHMTAEDSVAVLEKIWAFFKEARLNKDKLKNKLLLAKDNYGHTDWNQAAEKSQFRVIRDIMELG